jgi:hypothetical protein
VPGQPIGPITWTDYKAYTAPTGLDLAHVFPAIAIDRGDSTGANKHVYIGWVGDTHRVATNRMYLIGASVNNPTTSGWSAPIALDAGTNHSNMFPWLVAGRDGVVDAAWYSGRLGGSGATCPTGQTGSPNDTNGVNNNCFNQWHVTFAQVTNAASANPTVTTSFASDINHRGSICDQGLNCSLFGGDRSLLDFFDMALDPAGGANIAYVSDPAQVRYTRQCTGKSALTGLALNRDCGPLAPPGPGGPTTVCGTGTNHSATPITDPTGDATNPTGGPNNGSTDATSVRMVDAGSNIDVSLSVANLTDPAVPPAGTADIFYYVTWIGPDGNQYGVEHDEPAPSAAKTYSVGQYDASTNQLQAGATTITGSYVAGTPGTIVWHVPKALIGNPSVPVTVANVAHAAAQHPYAIVTVGLGAVGTGLVFVQPADRAPNGGFGASWSVC